MNADRTQTNKLFQQKVNRYTRDNSHVMALSLASPPVDFAFNKLLLRIAAEISEDELRMLKERRAYLFPKQEECDSALMFLKTLRDRGVLSRDNIDILKVILQELNRKDLLTEAVKFFSDDFPKINVCESNKFLYCTNDNFEGLFSLKAVFDPNSIDRQTVEDVRSRLSNIVLVPCSAILVGPIRLRPLSVVYLLPELYQDCIIKAFSDKSCLSGMSSLGICRVEIKGENGYECVDICTKNMDAGNSVKQIVSKRINDLKQELNKSKAESAALDRELVETYIKLHEAEDKLKKGRDMENKLAMLHISSGMSTTLWKLTGELNEDNNPINKPEKSHDEINRECLYKKIQRIYPHIDNERNPTVYRPNQGTQYGEQNYGIAVKSHIDTPLVVELKHKPSLNTKCP
ncbi:hypothetical protein MAR_017511 [Mya arenaria]|uniref:DED domain-containing protein n=1 Tax=Mya arenaria TaxID=6604 RepID=A0ABY7EFU7_MYAAR|nr:hypothetical protein MAR_017511 [Mya arenaria]